MVIYEVNLTIQNVIFEDYYHWLLQHVQEMLKHQGFQKAEMGLIEDQDAKQRKIRISYTIHSSLDLQHYLEYHAADMRAIALEKFGDQFSASRRIIRDPIILEAEK